MSDTTDPAATDPAAPWLDYAWYGPPEAMEAAVAGLPNVIGPRILDGVAFVTVRSATPLERPPGLLEAGPNLSAAVLGQWVGDPGDVPSQVTSYQGAAAMLDTPTQPITDPDTGAISYASNLYDDVDAFCRAAGGKLLLAWQRASFVRESDFIQGLGAQFLPATAEATTQEQIDDVFRRAGKVR